MPPAVIPTRASPPPPSPDPGPGREGGRTMRGQPRAGKGAPWLGVGRGLGESGADVGQGGQGVGRGHRTGTRGPRPFPTFGSGEECCSPGPVRTIPPPVTAPPRDLDATLFFWRRQKTSIVGAHLLTRFLAGNVAAVPSSPLSALRVVGGGGGDGGHGGEGGAGAGDGLVDLPARGRPPSRPGSAGSLLCGFSKMA